jgi:hypothetical protein
VSETVKQDLSHAAEAYLNAMALYAALKDANDFRVRRAEIRQGGVPAEPIDFVCDVEYRAKQAVLRNPRLQPMWQILLRDPWDYESMPEQYREEIGQEFLTGNLGIEGDYKVLYFRVKNNK